MHYLPIQRRVHVSRCDGVDAYGMRCPFGREGFGQLDHGCFGGVVGTLLLWVQDAGGGDGGEEDDGAAGFGGDHVARAGLRYEERARQVDVEEAPEHGGVVGFGLYVGAEREGG